MNRLATIAVWLVVIVVASFMLYRVKYEVQAIRSQIAQLSNDLEQEKEAMHVVAAEWAYLNRPERLRALSARYLASSGITVEQIADVQAIPYPSHMEAKAEAKPSSGVTPASFREGANVP